MDNWYLYWVNWPNILPFLTLISFLCFVFAFVSLHLFLVICGGHRDASNGLYLPIPINSSLFRLYSLNLTWVSLQVIKLLTLCEWLERLRLLRPVKSLLKSLHLELIKFKKLKKKFLTSNDDTLTKSILYLALGR